MSDVISISVVVPVRNEAANLPQCLARLTRFAEVVVVDSSSNDGTPEIARDHGARVINFEWNGSYPKKRNWMLLNHTLMCAWVLFLDADELIDDDFCDAAEKAITATIHVGYWLNYTNYFLGARLDHGVTQRKLALFKVGSGLYERIDEEAWSSLDIEVHEHPVLDGSVGEISERIDHRDMRGLDRFIERHIDYARWEARRVELLREDDAQAWNHLTSRQRFKYSHLSKWWYPWFYFLYAYIGRAGFLDGAAGLHYTFYKLWYFQTIRLLIHERGIAPIK